MGTPGVNPLPAAAGAAIGAGMEQSAGAGFDIAMKLQGERNEGEYASLMLDHSANIMNATEQIKKQDADNPDKMSGDLTTAIAKSLEVESQRASNPFVKLAVQKGDPAAQMWALRQINLDAADQGWRNTLKHAINTGNDYANKAMEIGGDPSLSPQDMMQRIAPLMHGADLLKTSIENSLHTEMAPGIYDGVVKGIMKGVIDPTLTSQPWKTSALLANPGISKYFTPDEMKTYQDKTDQALKAWPVKMQTMQIQAHLTQYPDLVNDVMAGKKGFAAIDSAQRRDPDQGNASFYNYLKDISLNVTSASGANAIMDKSMLKSKVVDDAVKIGLKLPGQFASAEDQKGFLAPKIDTNIEKLYAFRDELLSAKARLIISPGEFETYFKQLAVPLTAATLKNHDPNWFDQMAHGSQLGPDGQIKKQGWMATADPTKVDDFRSAYNIIERNLKLQQMDEKSPEYLDAKSDAYDAYFKALEGVKPGQLNALGRPYSQQDVAHAVMGEALGQEWIVKGRSMGKVAGYDPKDGMPIIDTDKEWQALVASQGIKGLR